jgi:hypothetical protein
VNQVWRKVHAQCGGGSVSHADGSSLISGLQRVLKKKKKVRTSTKNGDEEGDEDQDEESNNGSDDDEDEEDGVHEVGVEGENVPVGEAVETEQKTNVDYLAGYCSSHVSVGKLTRSRCLND